MLVPSVKAIGSMLNVRVEDIRQVRGFFVDGRKCIPGALYCALRGEKVDGHLFLEQAAKKGAIAAIVETEYEGECFGLTLLRVADPLEALHHLAKEILLQRKPFIIGVTGSIGKTTVKEFIAELLSPFYCVDKSPDSYNGQIGVPIAILNANPKAAVLVLEMGMSYKNELDRLVEIAPPDFAVMTRIAPAHLGHFESLQEIAHEKCKILSSPCLKHAFIHFRSHSYINQQTDSYVLSSYGSSSADVNSYQQGDCWILVDRQRKEEVQLPITFSEKHIVENLVIAAKVAREMGVPYEKLKERIKSLKPFKHRFEKIPLEYPHGALMIDDSYNNNPVALKTTLYNLPTPKGQGKVIAVLGEMKELGQASHMAYQEIALMALLKVDYLLCYGIETAPLYQKFLQHHPHAFHFLDKGELVIHLETVLKEDDVVLIKGANSNRLWEILDLLKTPLLKIC